MLAKQGTFKKAVSLLYLYYDKGFNRRPVSEITQKLVYISDFTASVLPVLGHLKFWSICSILVIFSLAWTLRLIYSRAVLKMFGNACCED